MALSVAATGKFNRKSKISKRPVYKLTQEQMDQRLSEFNITLDREIKNGERCSVCWHPIWEEEDHCHECAEREILFKNKQEWREW